MADTSDDAAHDDRPALATLRHHQRRRDAGLPTVTVLTGPADAAAAAWERWAVEAGHRPAVHRADAIADLVAQLVRHVVETCDLPRLALNALSSAAGRPPTASTSPLAPPLDGRTSLDVDALAEPALAAPDPAGTAAIAHELCRLAVDGLPPPAELVDRLDARLADRGDPPRWRVLRALDPLLPVGACPAVLLVCPVAPPPAVERLDALARAAAELAQAVPGWPVALAVAPADVQRYRDTAPESRAKSLLTTGVVPIEPQATPTRPPVGPDHAPPADSPADPAAAATAAALGRSVDEVLDDARSRAERLLFDMLERHPKTRGRFVLNGCPGFHFGTRPAEVDLLAGDLRIAVEVDGFFHFTQQDNYRRDRRKDWLLQRHGYTVVRVLADDVPSRAEAVLDFLLTVVDHCQQAATAGIRGGPEGFSA